MRWWCRWYTPTPLLPRAAGPRPSRNYETLGKAEGTGIPGWCEARLAGPRGVESARPYAPWSTDVSLWRDPEEELALTVVRVLELPVVPTAMVSRRCGPHRPRDRR